MIKAVIYGRSNPNDDINNQVLELEEYAKNNNMKITKKYLDEGYSGYSYDRPFLKIIQHDADLSKFDTLLMTEMKVLSRDYSQAFYYLNYFREHNIRVIFTKNSLDTDILNKDYDIFFEEVLEVFYATNNNN